MNLAPVSTPALPQTPVPPSRVASSDGSPARETSDRQVRHEPQALASEEMIQAESPTYRVASMKSRQSNAGRIGRRLDVLA